MTSARWNLCVISFSKGSPISFARCLSYAERCPDRFILGYAPDPRKPNAIDKLKSAVSMYGVKVYGELKIRMMLDDWDAIRMYRVCGELGLPVRDSGLILPCGATGRWTP